MTDSFLQRSENRRLSPEAAARRQRALSAGVDARAAVPLQSRPAPAAARSTIPTRSSTSDCRSQECLDAVDECGAPIVAIPGGEPLIHRDIGEIVKGIVARKKFVSLCTNALLLEKKLHLFEPSPYLFFSVHLDGLKDHHDKSVAQEGVFDIAVSAIKKAAGQGASPSMSTRRSSTAIPPKISPRSSISPRSWASASRSRPATPMSGRRTRNTSSIGKRPSSCFARVFALGKGKKWRLMHSTLFLDFLAGNRDFHCTPWGMPTRNVFGWQKPCYLLGEGYAGSFKELMETTDWDNYGTGRYEKCANCMAHCGYEPTAADATIRRHSQRCGRRFAACVRRARWRRKSRSTGRGRRNTFSRHVERCWPRLQPEADSDAHADEIRESTRAIRHCRRPARDPAIAGFRRESGRHPQCRLHDAHLALSFRSSGFALRHADGRPGRLAPRGRRERFHGGPLPPEFEHRRAARRTSSGGKREIAFERAFQLLI